MWKIRLPRDQDILVTKEEAEWVKDQLKTGSDDFIEIAGQIIKRSQIMAIVSGEVDETISKEMAQERATVIEEWKEREGHLTLESPEEKAEREIRCKVPIIWFIRTLSLEIPNDIREKVKTLLIGFFNENPKEAWGCQEVYNSLLPPRALSKHEGLISVKDIIKGRAQI